MSKINDLKLENLDALFPADFTPDQIAKGKTLFLKELAESMHKFFICFCNGIMKFRILIFSLSRSKK